MKHSSRPPKRSAPSLWPNQRFGDQIKKLFSMLPVKIAESEKLTVNGGVFLITDLDGLDHPRMSKSIRAHAVRVCSANPKSDLAEEIALRRTGIETFPSPNGKHTKTYLFAHNRKLRAAKRRALGELPLCGIRFVVEDDEDRRKLLKQFVDMHLSDMEWKAQNQATGKERKRLIGLAKN